MNSFPGDDNPYAADSDSGSAQPQRTSGKATASLVLGITSLVPCISVLAGVPAIIFGALGLGDIKHSQGRLTGRGMAITGIVTGGIGSTLIMVGFLLALLLPAVQAARQTARRAVSLNNMKQIGLAVQIFHDRDQHMPAAATRDEAGNPLLSWRVAILPYLEEPVLFKEFNQDEPWNGPANQLLVAREPRLYTSPNDEHRAPGETNVFGIVDQDTILTSDGGINLGHITDGPAKTIVAVELAGSGIAWSEPRDITIEEFIAAMQRSPADPGLHPCYPDGAICVFADGAARFIPSDAPPETLRALCTRAGGEPVVMPGLE